MEEKIKQANPTLHRYLFTVTTFSKLLAMFLFILFPFVGFYLGMKYQQLSSLTPQTTIITKVVMPSITPLPTFTKNVGEYFYINVISNPTSKNKVLSLTVKDVGKTFSVSLGSTIFISCPEGKLLIEPKTGVVGPAPGIYNLGIDTCFVLRAVGIGTAKITVQN